MQILKNYITNFVNTNIIPLGVTAIFVVIVLIAFAFLAPSSKLKEWAKGHIGYLLLGAALLYTASSIAVDIAANFGF